MDKEKIKDSEVNTLLDFKFDEPEFFGIPSTEKNEIDETVKKVKSADDDLSDPTIEDDNIEVDGKVKTVNNDKSTDDDGDEDNFFTNEDVDDNKGADDNIVVGTDYKSLTQQLKEKGIFQNVEITDDEDITEDKFLELQDTEIEARVTETFEAFFEELDEDGKAFLKHKKNGGTTEEFMQTYKNTISLEGLDTENESDQEIILTHYMRVIDAMDEDEITDRLDWLKENKKSKTFADKYYAKLQDIDNQRKSQLLEESEKNAKIRDQKAAKFNSELSEELNKIETVGSFSFNKVDKKELYNFITKPTVKVGKNKYITPLVAEVSEIFKGEGENKQKLLILAKLINSNFDVKDLIEEAKTKVVKDAKGKLQAAKTEARPSTSGGNTRKSLADYF